MAVIDLILCDTPGCNWFNPPGVVCSCKQLPAPKGFDLEAHKKICGNDDCGHCNGTLVMPAIDLRPDPDAHLGAVCA